MTTIRQQRSRFCPLGRHTVVFALFLSLYGHTVSAQDLPLTPQQHQQKREFFIDAMSARLGHDPEGIGRAAAAYLLTQDYLMIKEGARLWEERRNDSSWRGMLPRGGDGFLKEAHAKYQEFQKNPQAFRDYFQDGMNRYEEKATLARTGKLPDFMGEPFDYLELAGGAVGVAHPGAGFGLAAASFLGRKVILDPMGKAAQTEMIDRLGQLPGSEKEYMRNLHDNIERDPKLKEATSPWVKKQIRTSIDAGPLEMAQANADVAEEKLKAVRLLRATAANPDQDARLALLEKTFELNRQRTSEILAQVKNTGSAILEAKREQEYANKLMLAQGKYVEQLLKERAQDEIKREIRQLEREALHDGLSALTTGLRLAGNQQIADVMDRFVQRGIALSNAFEKARLLETYYVEHPHLMKGNELTPDLIRGANIALFAFDFISMLRDLDGQNSLLESMRKEFANLKDQMHARFDRVDASLSTIYQTIISESVEDKKTQAETLKRLDAILGNAALSEQRIMGAVARLERKYEESRLQSTLDRLTKCLNYKGERTTPLSAEEFAKCMDALYAGAVRDRIISGPPEAADRELIVNNFLRNGNDSDIPELAAIARTYGFDGIGSGRLRSLSDWQLCVDGYLLMAAAYPDLYHQEFRTGSNRFKNQPTQVDKMIEAGAQSIKAVSGLGGKTQDGMGRLFDDYIRALKGLKDGSLKRRSELENQNLPKAMKNLGGFDAAKPIDQAFPDNKPHKSYAPYTVTWCPSIKDKRTINDTYYLGSDAQFTITGLQKFIPPAYLLAENLGLGAVKPGIFQMHHYEHEKRTIVSFLIVGEYYPAGKGEPSGHVFRRVVELPYTSIPFHESYRNLQKSQEDVKAVNENYRKTIQKHLDDHFLAPDSRDAFDPKSDGFQKDAERRQNAIAANDDTIRKQTAEMYDVINHRYVAAATYFADYIKGLDITKAALDNAVLTHKAISGDLNPAMQALRAEVSEALASDITAGQLKSAGDDLTRSKTTTDALLRLGWNDRVRMYGVFYSLFGGEYRLPTQRDLAGAYKTAAYDSELGLPDGILLDPVANRKHILRAEMNKEEYDKLIATLKQEIESHKVAAEDKKAEIRKQILLHSKQLEDVHLTRWVRVILPYAQAAFLEDDFANRIGWKLPKLIELMVQLKGANEVTSEQLLVLKLAALYQLVFKDLSSSTGGEYARADRTLKELQKFQTATDDPLYPLIQKLYLSIERPVLGQK